MSVNTESTVATRIGNLPFQVPSRDEIIARQREFFNSHHTLDLNLRIGKLRQLQAVLRREEPAIVSALREDLGKAHFEAYGTELGIVLEELGFALSHLRRWAKPRRAPTPLVHFPSASRVYPEPLGVVLIISPWNYPLLLTLSPLISAIAAGNCAVIKPSRHVPHTAQVMEAILQECFEPDYVAMFRGGDELNDWLLSTRFDHIFFTGSPRVARVVMAAAARYLTPLTLELGGKSPCIVDRTANLELAARRIAWGKSINAGQTCVAPDYLLVHQDRKAELVERIRATYRQFYGADPLTHPDFPKIINTHHFDRLCGLMAGANILLGGRSDRTARKIEPTLLDGVTLDHPVMKEEIFGPLLPVLTFSQIDEALEIIRHFEKPLSLYLFTHDRAVERRILSTVSFGGGAVNDTLIQFVNPHLPFGGVGESGFGSYHGAKGFETFSHLKSVTKKAEWLDIPFRNPPFAGHLDILKLFLH